VTEESRPGSPLQALPGHAERTPPDGELPVARTAAAADRRRRILAATGELIAKRGYHGTTLELIVRRAHVGYPAFYKLFADKEAAFLALFDAVVTRTVALIGQAVDECAGETWPERLAGGLRALFDAVAAHPLLARACLVEVLTAGSEAVARYEAALREIATILLARRELSPQVEELSGTLDETLIGGVAWIVYQRLVAGEAERVPELLSETLEFVLVPFLGEGETARIVAEYG
jgi:AcrR family transcriptional regulator